MAESQWIQLPLQTPWGGFVDGFNTWQRSALNTPRVGFESLTQIAEGPKMQTFSPPNH